MKNKENIFDEVLSVESISKLYFEFNFIKMFIFENSEIKKIEEIYSDILNERVIIESLRKVIYEREDPNLYFEKWSRLENNEKIELFLEK